MLDQSEQNTKVIYISLSFPPTLLTETFFGSCNSLNSLNRLGVGTGDPPPLPPRKKFDPDSISLVGTIYHHVVAKILGGSNFCCDQSCILSASYIKFATFFL